MQRAESKAPIPLDKLILGLALVAVGVIAFGAAVDFWMPVRWTRLWPLVLIVVGAGAEFESMRHRRSDGGSFMLATGVWLLAGSLHLFGLRYATAWPLGVAVFGALYAVHALIDRPQKEKERE